MLNCRLTAVLIMEELQLQLQANLLQMIRSYGEEIRKEIKGIKGALACFFDKGNQTTMEAVEAVADQKDMQTNQKNGFGIDDGFGADDFNKSDYGLFAGQKENGDLEEEEMVENIHMDFDFPTGKWKFAHGFILLDYKRTEEWNIKKLLGYFEGVFQAAEGYFEGVLQVGEGWRQQDLTKVLDRQRYWNIKVKKKERERAVII